MLKEEFRRKRREASITASACIKIRLDAASEWQIDMVPALEPDTFVILQCLDSEDVAKARLNDASESD